MPNQPKTPLRSFRIPDELYLAAQRQAQARGENVSDVIRRALEQYVEPLPPSAMGDDTV